MPSCCHKWSCANRPRKSPHTSMSAQEASVVCGMGARAWFAMHLEQGNITGPPSAASLHLSFSRPHLPIPRIARFRSTPRAKEGRAKNVQLHPAAPSLHLCQGMMMNGAETRARRGRLRSGRKQYQQAAPVSYPLFWVSSDLPLQLIFHSFL